MLVIVSYTQRNKTNGEQELETLTRLTITRLRWQPSRKIISVTSALDLKSQGVFFCFVALSNRRLMTKKIYLAIVLLLLGSLACMQSAPSSLTLQAPTKPATQSARAAQSITESECKVIATALNVRDCGGIDCSVIGWLEAGWIVQAEPSSIGSSWIYITHGTLKGYARSNYLLCNIGGLQK